MNQIQLSRVMMMEENFQRVILGSARGSYAAFEAKAMPLAAELMPYALPDLHKVLIRLITLFVKDAKGLVEHITPRYIDFVQGYLFNPEQDPAKQELASTFWLFRSTNPQLQAIEAAHTAGFMPYLVTNVHAVYVVRAWIRMQAMLIDMGKIDLIMKISALYGEHPCADFLPSIGYNQIDAENFAALDSEAQNAAVADAAPIATQKAH